MVIEVSSQRTEEGNLRGCQGLRHLLDIFEQLIDIAVLLVYEVGFNLVMKFLTNIREFLVYDTNIVEAIVAVENGE